MAYTCLCNVCSSAWISETWKDIGSVKIREGASESVESEALVTLTSDTNLGPQHPCEAGHRNAYLQSQLSYGEMGGRETQRSASLANVKKQTSRESLHVFLLAGFLPCPALPTKIYKNKPPKLEKDTQVLNENTTATLDFRLPTQTGWRQAETGPSTPTVRVLG